MKHSLRLLALLLVLAQFVFALPATAASQARNLPQQSDSTTPSPVSVKVTRSANLRGGPGTTFAVVGGATAGQTLEIVAKNSAGDWFKTADGKWIFGQLLESTPDVPVDTSITPSSATTPAATPRTVATPAATISSPATQPTSTSSNTTAKVSGNLRSGPGTNYARIGSVSAGDALELIGRDSSSAWYQLETGEWISGSLINNAPTGLEVVEASVGATGSIPQAERVAAATYAFEMLEIMEDYATTSNTMSATILKLVDDPFLMFDQDWKYELGATFGYMMFLNDRIQEIDVPPSLAAVHAEYVAASELTDDAMDLFSRAIDNLDFELVPLATEKFEQATERIEAAERLLNGISID